MFPSELSEGEGTLVIVPKHFHRLGDPPLAGFRSFGVADPIKVSPLMTRCQGLEKGKERFLHSEGFQNIPRNRRRIRPLCLFLRFGTHAFFIIEASLLYPGPDLLSWNFVALMKFDSTVMKVAAAVIKSILVVPQQGALKECKRNVSLKGPQHAHDAVMGKCGPTPLPVFLDL